MQTYNFLSLKYGKYVSAAVVTAIMSYSVNETFTFVLVFRRKLKSDISAAFPSLSADELSELVPNKQELNVVKIYAHKGDAVTLYVLQKNPLFFEVEKRLYPTGFISTLH